MPNYNQVALTIQLSCQHNAKRAKPPGFFVTPDSEPRSIIWTTTAHPPPQEAGKVSAAFIPLEDYTEACYAAAGLLLQHGDNVTFLSLIEWEGKFKVTCFWRVKSN